MKEPILLFAMVLAAHISLGQTTSGPIPDRGILANPFIGSNAPVPLGYRFDIAAASPVYGSTNNMSLFGWTSLSLAGVLQLGYRNEGYVGDLVGVTRACPGWDAKIQILRKREELPSLALWMSGTIGWQKESLGANDLWGNVPANSFFEVLWTQYEFNSTAVGLTMEPGFGDNIAVNLSIGYRELESRDLWIVSMIYPGIGDSYHSVNSDRTSLLEGSINLMVRALPQVALILQASTLPYYKLNQLSSKIDLGRAYLGTMGMRYSLPIPVFVDGYVRWHSNFNGQTDTQIRLGLSSEVQLN
jgi:hypothetical protein